MPCSAERSIPTVQTDTTIMSGTQYSMTAEDRVQWRAPTLVQPANLRAAIKSGKLMFGTALTFPSRHVAKWLAVTGADWLWIDAEHVGWSPKLLVECIQIIIHESGGNMIPVVRVPSKKAYDWMSWALDAGAGGIIVPHMESAEEMKEVIANCRFPPIGHRSYPPFTFLPGLNDYAGETPGETPFSLANKHVAIIPQIESSKGIANLAEIIAFDEVSAFMVGPGDLRLDLGLPLGFVGEEPTFLDAMAAATKAAKERDIPIAGFAIGPEMLKLRLDQGYRLILNMMDMHAMMFGILTELGTGRAVAEEYLKSKAAAQE
ncbi:Pyruvate/Phosphoenolpyruvate kinase-like domain-containing protein [Mycena amicta]|nr:Pyruvate/Phosphoenolpyruvate kinase-like domain-containing protein [Mycena amicta]